MGLADRLGKAFGWKSGQAQPQPTARPEPAKPAEPKYSPPKEATLKDVLKEGKPLPAARALPGATSQLRDALTQKLAEERGQAKPAPKPVEREASKLQPKFQPPRTPGPGPSQTASGVRYVNRTSTAHQQARPQPEAGQQQPADRKAVDEYRRDRTAADRQKDADRQQPARETDQYRRGGGDRDKGIDR